MVKSSKSEAVSDKILFSFYEQFATNQNHHQTVFIQFLSAILVVLTGYGYVYVNTSAQAELTELTRYSTALPSTLSYSLNGLFGTYLIAQLILTLLGTVILNIGYGFRRDQKVIYNIRKKYLKSEYEDYFGKMSFNPKGLNLMDYLPEFSRMFYLGIFLLHLLLFISFYFKIKYNNNCSLHLSSLCYWSFFVICLFPLFWSIWLYFNYYKKYYWIMTDSKVFWLKDWNYLKNSKG